MMIGGDVANIELRTDLAHYKGYAVQNDDGKCWIEVKKSGRSITPDENLYDSMGEALESLISLITKDAGIGSCKIES